MKEPCKKCEKTLGILDRSFKIENKKLNIYEEPLCKACYTIIKEGTAKIDDMYQWMMGNLKKNKYLEEKGTASIEIDLLLLVAVEALFSIEPRFYDKKTTVHQSFLKNKGEQIDRQKDIVRLLYKLLNYGFEENLKAIGLDSSKKFMAYMLQNALFLEKIEVNSDVDERLVKANLFISRRGLMIEVLEPRKLMYIPISGDTYVDYEVATSEIINELTLNDVSYPWDEKKHPVFTVGTEKELHAIANVLDRFNQKTKHSQDQEKREALSCFNDRVVEDLEKLKPRQAVETIHLDCLLLCIVKNLKSERIFTLEALFDPKGTAIELLWIYYEKNLRNMGIDDNDKVVTYLLKNTIYAESFNIKHGNKPSDKGWGFFTTKGYIIYFKRSRQVFFIYTDTFPNGIYHPCTRITYDDKEYLQLIMNSGKNKEDYRELDELIFYSEKEDTITQMEHFFQRHNLYFQMETFLQTQKNFQENREKSLEIRRVINHIFSDLGYLPYCIYDEWYCVQKSLQESDPLLGRIIELKEDQKKKFTQEGITYAPKLLATFRESAKNCQKSLEIKDESVALAILWVAFKDAVTETLSDEWVRIAGEILQKGDNALAAFFRYVNLKNIEPDKVYYMGLFIYHLMSEGILPKENFLNNYEGAVRIFLECRRVIQEPRLAGEPVPMEDLLEQVFPKVS